MTKADARKVQVLLNRYFRGKKLGLSPLKVDGVFGKVTKMRIKWARYFMGVGPGKVRGQNDKVTDEFLRTLRKPRRRLKDQSKREHKARIKTVHHRQANRRKHLKEQRGSGSFGSAPGNPHWGGSMHVIMPSLTVARRHGAYLASAKRPSWHSLSRSNPGSDHNMANVYAYAHDYGISGYPGTRLAYALATSLRLSGFRTGNYTGYRVVRHGISFTAQDLWQVQGHYDHVHLGCHRA